MATLGTHSPVREEFAELVGGIDENIELRRRLPIKSKHVGGEVVDVHFRERRASRFDARVWANGTAPSALWSSRTVAKGRLSRSTSRTEELTSKDSVEAQRSW